MCIKMSNDKDLQNLYNQLLTYKQHPQFEKYTAAIFKLVSQKISWFVMS